MNTQSPQPRDDETDPRDSFGNPVMFDKRSDAEGTEDWLDYEGRPSLAYLRSLATEATPESLETLRGLAEDHDVDASDDASPLDLAEKVWEKLQSEQPEEYR